MSLALCALSFGCLSRVHAAAAGCCPTENFLLLTFYPGVIHDVFSPGSENYWGFYFNCRRKCLCALWSLGAAADARCVAVCALERVAMRVLELGGAAAGCHCQMCGRVRFCGAGRCVAVCALELGWLCCCRVLVPDVWPRWPCAARRHWRAPTQLFWLSGAYAGIIDYMSCLRTGFVKLCMATTVGPCSACFAGPRFRGSHITPS